MQFPSSFQSSKHDQAVLHRDPPLGGAGTSSSRLPAPAIACCCLATLSLAALTLSSEPAYAKDFAGPRVELSAGYDAIKSDGSYEDFPDKLSGVHARAAVGFDLAASERLVLGLETSIGASRNADASTLLGQDTFRFEPGRDIDVLARIGYRVGSRTMIYAKAGWANAKLKIIQRELVGNGQYEVTRSSADNDGLRLGAGVEHRLTDGVYAKAEYRHTSFGDGYAYQPGTIRRQILLGFGYRF